MHPQEAIAPLRTPGVLPNATPVLTRTPAAAVSLFPASSGLPATCRCLCWMRGRKGYALVPSASQTAARSVFPSRAAVVLVAAGEVPVTLMWPISLGANRV